MKYLNNVSWSAWTRDERFFCATLYHLASNDIRDFGEWICSKTDIEYNQGEQWDLGYEVCFYRDYFWQKGMSAKQKGFSAKRTFDFCLFNTNKIIIIESKVFESFKLTQNSSFDNDIRLIRQIPDLQNIDVHIVALASSIYFKNAETFGGKSTLDVFNGKYITWKQLSEKYNSSLLNQAELLYKSKPKFSALAHHSAN